MRCDRQRLEYIQMTRPSLLCARIETCHGFMLAWIVPLHTWEDFLSPGGGSSRAYLSAALGPCSFSLSPSPSARASPLLYGLITCRKAHSAPCLSFLRLLLSEVTCRRLLHQPQGALKFNAALSLVRLLAWLSTKYVTVVSGYLPYFKDLFCAWRSPISLTELLAPLFFYLEINCYIWALHCSFFLCVFSLHFDVGTVLWWLIGVKPCSGHLVAWNVWFNEK